MIDIEISLTLCYWLLSSVATILHNLLFI